jgi:hypothetical protein
MIGAPAMLTHVVLMTWKPGITADQVAAVGEGFARLAQDIPQIRSYRFGPDQGLYPGNADYALVAAFDSEADLRAYASHPLHRAFLKEVTGPLLASFSAAQF